MSACVICGGVIAPSGTWGTPLAFRKTCGARGCVVEHNRRGVARRKQALRAGRVVARSPSGRDFCGDTRAIDRLLVQARAARLAEERRLGRRRYTLDTGWIQRPGVGEGGWV